MIVVLADDFSGAAELANVAVCAGLSAEVQMGGFTASEADVVCIDADSRPLPADEAAARWTHLGHSVAAHHSAFVFKKCDSVLRGNVAVEAHALAVAISKTRVLLVPANPSRGRIIRGGLYFVNGTLLAETAFAADPEHPRWTSLVAELLGDSADIEIPDATSADDLARLAASVDGTTLAVGAADFFGALLTRVPSLAHVSSPAPARAVETLFVCGSSAAWLAGRREQCAQHGVPIFAMPQALFSRDAAEDVLSRWAAFAAAGLREQGAAMLALGSGDPAPDVTAAMLTERLAQAVEETLAHTPCARVALEGGATALAVLRQLGHRRFHALVSPGAGVGALLPHGGEGPIFLAKPGSYDWPVAVWPR